MMGRSLLLALQFLTRIPVPTVVAVEDREVGRSLLWYPLVGLVLGLALAALSWGLAGVPLMLRAALVLAVWAAITGALHLDGLGDSADAWMGGLGSRERTLAIMKDPYSGPGAVVVLVAVLLIKFAALESILATGDWTLLLLAPVLGRVALPLLFLTTAYVRPDGLGSALAQHLPRRAGIVLVLASVLCVAVAMGKIGVVSLAVAAAMFLVLRTIMLHRIYGTTGDTAGAMVELIETSVLVTVAIASTENYQSTF